MISPHQYFKDPKLLRHALTHRSYCNEHPGSTSNERLEFLGDSVLSLIISDRLYRLFPTEPEGDLTSRRSFLVQTTTLAQKSAALGLDSQLLLSRGETDLGGRTNPSLLANTFEAVLGALYLDSGLDTCRDYLLQIFPDNELAAAGIAKDPKSLLQEKSQENSWGTPSYQLVQSVGPDHAKTFTVEVKVNGQPEATGTGTSKQRAESEAAKQALAKLFPAS